MIIHWSPQNSRRHHEFRQPSPDTLTVDGDAYAFDESVEFDLPDGLQRYVSSAKRIDGVLHLWMPWRYQGSAPAPTVVDYGTDEDLMQWQK